MGYIRRKIKTTRRVKRTKSRNTRKRKQNRTFRKSRRVDRGGAGKRSRGAMEDNWQEDTRTEKEKSEQDAIENEKDTKNELKRVANIKKNMYLEPEVRGVRVDQAKKLKITEDQLRLMDDIDAETEGEEEDLEGGPLSFGGKKKRIIKKK